VVFLGEEREDVSVMVKDTVCHFRKLITLEFTSGKLVIVQLASVVFTSLISGIIRVVWWLEMVSSLY
jgi:hypothetical protein